MLLGIEFPDEILIDEKPVTLDECYSILGLERPKPTSQRGTMLVVTNGLKENAWLKDYKRNNPYPKFKWVSLVLFEIPPIQFPKACEVMGYMDEYLEEYFGEYNEHGQGD